MLLGAGASFGASAYGALLHPTAAPLGRIALWAALASIISKEVLYRATHSVGQQLNSPILIANAWHHRSDAMCAPPPPPPPARAIRRRDRPVGPPIHHPPTRSASPSVIYSV